MKRAVFLDRDGVINNAIVKEGNLFSPRKFEDFKFVDGIKDVLERFRERGLLNIIVTNQPDVARGLMEEKELQKMHNLIRESLPIDDIFICPHSDADNCNCRKPKAGMLFEAAKKWDIYLNESFIIGDSWKDIEAGRNAGCTTVLIDSPYNKQIDSDFRTNELLAVADMILNSQKKE